MSDFDQPELFPIPSGAAIRYKPPTDNLGRRLIHTMWDEKWHTLPELAARTGYGEATVSARMRRFPTDNNLDYSKRPTGEGQTWEYRLVLPW